MLIEKLQAAGFDVGVFYHQELARVFVVVSAIYLVWKRKNVKESIV